MEKIDILIWVMGIGFAFNFALMKLFWSHMNSKLDKIDEKITDMDRRLCRLEGAFSSKECCVLQDQRLKKAE